MFGWRIVKTLTCSEAVEGIKTFIADLSLKNEILHFEEDFLIDEIFE